MNEGFSRDSGDVTLLRREEEASAFASRTSSFEGAVARNCRVNRAELVTLD
jgi:hypothetical protein